MDVAPKTTINEYLFELFPNINNRFIDPNRTRVREKKVFIAFTAIINSVARSSMWEYHFHILGTKKCQIPKPIEAALPVAINILASRLLILRLLVVNSLPVQP